MAVEVEIDHAAYLEFHDSRLVAIERQDDTCVVRIEHCYLYVRVEDVKLRYDVHHATVELRATSVKGVFLDPNRPDDWIDEAAFWRESREVDDAAVRRGEPFDEVIFRFAAGDRRLQVTADTIRLVIVDVGPTVERWYGALDDPNARVEHVRSLQ